MLVVKCEIEPLSDEADREISSRVPDALGVFVVDREGRLHPFRLSNAQIAKYIDENAFRLRVSEIKKVNNLNIIAFKGSDCILATSYGDGVILC